MGSPTHIRKDAPVVVMVNQGGKRVPVRGTVVTCAPKAGWFRVKLTDGTTRRFGVSDIRAA